MNCRNAFKVHTDNVFIPSSVCDEFASGVVGAAVEEAVFAVSEDKAAAAGVQDLIKIMKGGDRFGHLQTSFFERLARLKMK